MARTLRTLLVACMAAAFAILPLRRADARDIGTSPAADTSHSVSQGRVWRSALALVPGEAPLMRQSVASTNESKTLIGLASAGAAIGGLGMLAYGSSSSCKGKPGNDTTTCERLAVIGSVSLGAGVAALALWALSR